MNLPMEAATKRHKGDKFWIVLGCAVSLLIGLAIGHAVTYKITEALPLFLLPTRLSC